MATANNARTSKLASENINFDAARMRTETDLVFDEAVIGFRGFDLDGVSGQDDKIDGMEAEEIN